MRYVPSLDAMRFFAASTVALFHLYIPSQLLAFETVYRSTFYGTAAVTVFFVISGFVIHAPLMGVERVSWNSFFVRRYLRILIPVAVIVPFGAMVNVSYSLFGGWVTWSLFCELVYYTAYPALREAAGRIGWGVLFVVSLAVSLALQASHLFEINAAIDLALNVVIYLPCWLIGCVLAEHVQSRKFDRVPVWPFRIAVFAASFACGFAHYHGLSEKWTMPFFAVLVAIWLLAEIRADKLPPLLCRLGTWSYSLYLVHPAAYGFAGSVIAARLPAGLNWPAHLFCAFGFALLFYLLVERPSHALARYASRKLSPMTMTSP